MTHHSLNSADLPSHPPGRPGLLRQAGNGLGGLIVLLITGVVLVIAVMLKSR
ncbi:MAG: hypothetical protein KKF33_18580 [Alphaproteobacteria bacterium]|jgi:hypothetical protein|nr:hypothetical protein [Alphaproteobacteria bacterium]